MEPYSTPVEYVPAIRELKNIALHGPGFSIIEAAQASDLLCLRGVSHVSTTRKMPPAAAAVVLVNSVVDPPGSLALKPELGMSGTDRGVAQALFALDESYGTAPVDRKRRAMRALYGAVQDGKNEAYERGLRDDQWNSYRKGALDRFLHRVCQLIDAAGHTTDVAMTTSKKPDYTYRLVSYEASLIFPAQDGDLRKTLVRRIIRAAVPTTSWRTSIRDWGHESSKREFEFIGDGKLTTLTHSDEYHGPDGKHGSADLLEVKFPHQLAIGDTAEFSIQITDTVPLSALMLRECQDRQGTTPILPTDEIRMRVRFPNGQIPSIIWRYPNLAPFAAPGVPGPDDILHADEFGGVSARWKEDIRVGESYGIGWEW